MAEENENENRAPCSLSLKPNSKTWPPRIDRIFHHAWIEYQVSGETNLLEQYTSGFIFAQLSTKQGINKYGREAKLQLLAEFKQLMEYRTFHGRKAEDLTYEQKKKAANMIKLTEEKINRGHNPDKPVIKGGRFFNGRVQQGLYTKK